LPLECLICQVFLLTTCVYPVGAGQRFSGDLTRRISPCQRGKGAGAIDQNTAGPVGDAGFGVAAEDWTQAMAGRRRSVRWVCRSLNRLEADSPFAFPPRLPPRALRLRVSIPFPLAGESQAPESQKPRPKHPIRIKIPGQSAGFGLPHASSRLADQVVSSGITKLPSLPAAPVSGCFLPEINKSACPGANDWGTLARHVVRNPSP
jgi:hypothetical protein